MHLDEEPGKCSLCKPKVVVIQTAHGTTMMNSSGILYPWTGLGKMVQASTYQYIPVQHGTGQYEISALVQDSMYQYILHTSTCFQQDMCDGGIKGRHIDM